MSLTRSTVPTGNLVRSLTTGDEDKIVNALRNANKAQRRSALRLILRILNKTTSSRVRNAAAIAVADLRSRNAEKLLIKLLTRNDTKRSRGTLLYALSEGDTCVPIDVLTKVIAQSRYEAQQEALRFFNAQLVDWKANELPRSINRLKRLVSSRDADRSQSAREALKIISKLNLGSSLVLQSKKRSAKRR